MKFSNLLAGVLAACALSACDAATDITDPRFASSQSSNARSTLYISTGKVDIPDPWRPEAPAFYRFTAKHERNGETKGKFDYTTELFAGTLVAQGDVVCMTVVELPNGVRKARLGGIVRSSNRPEFPAGHEFVWSITDDRPEAGQIETASTLLGLDDPGFARRYCENGLPYLESPVKGHIHLHPIGSGR